MQCINLINEKISELCSSTKGSLLPREKGWWFFDHLCSKRKLHGHHLSAQVTPTRPSTKLIIIRI